MTGNPEDAAEMAHTAFIKGFQKLNQYNSNYPFSRWIIGICCNRSKNLFRKRSRRRQAEESHLEYAYCAISGGGRDYQRQRLDEVSIALQRIPEKMRLPVAMKYMEDFSYEEIAAAMGIGVSAAKMRVKRGVEQLRQKLGPPFEEKNNAAAQ
jgi:RNA polymerase sigma-70 factor (ECF subfamily)